MLKLSTLLTATCLMLATPALAQTSATPTGKSDMKSTGMMKKGDAAKPHQHKMKHHSHHA